MTNIDFEAWGEYLGDPPLAMALLDRIVDAAIILKINGKSYRAHRASKPPLASDRASKPPAGACGPDQSPAPADALCRALIEQPRREIPSLSHTATSPVAQFWPSKWLNSWPRSTRAQTVRVVHRDATILGIGVGGVLPPPRWTSAPAPGWR